MSTYFEDNLRLINLCIFRDTSHRIRRNVNPALPNPRVIPRIRSSTLAMLPTILGNCAVLIPKLDRSRLAVFSDIRAFSKIEKSDKVVLLAMGGEEEAGEMLMSFCPITRQDQQKAAPISRPLEKSQSDHLPAHHRRMSSWQRWPIPLALFWWPWSIKRNASYSLNNQNTSI